MPPIDVRSSSVTMCDEWRPMISAVTIAYVVADAIERTGGER